MVENQKPKTEITNSEAKECLYKEVEADKAMWIYSETLGLHKAIEQRPKLTEEDLEKAQKTLIDKLKKYQEKLNNSDEAYNLLDAIIINNEDDSLDEDNLKNLNSYLERHKNVKKYSPYIYNDIKQDVYFQPEIEKYNIKGEKACGARKDTTTDTKYIKHRDLIKNIIKRNINGFNTSISNKDVPEDFIEDMYVTKDGHNVAIKCKNNNYKEAIKNFFSHDNASKENDYIIIPMEKFKLQIANPISFEDDKKLAFQNRISQLLQGNNDKVKVGKIKNIAIQNESKEVNEGQEIIKRKLIIHHDSDAGHTIKALKDQLKKNIKAQNQSLNNQEQTMSDTAIEQLVNNNFKVIKSNAWGWGNGIISIDEQLFKQLLEIDQITITPKEGAEATKLTDNQYITDKIFDNKNQKIDTSGWRYNKSNAFLEELEMSYKDKQTLSNKEKDQLTNILRFFDKNMPAEGNLFGECKVNKTGEVSINIKDKKHRDNITAILEEILKSNTSDTGGNPEVKLDKIQAFNSIYKKIDGCWCDPLKIFNLNFSEEEKECIDNIRKADITKLNFAVEQLYNLTIHIDKLENWQKMLPKDDIKNNKNFSHLFPKLDNEIRSNINNSYWGMGISGNDTDISKKGNILSIKMKDGKDGVEIHPYSPLGALLSSKTDLNDIKEIRIKNCDIKDTIAEVFEKGISKKQKISAELKNGTIIHYKKQNIAPSFVIKSTADKTEFENLLELDNISNKPNTQVNLHNAHTSNNRINIGPHKQ